MFLKKTPYNQAEKTKDRNIEIEGFYVGSIIRRGDMKVDEIVGMTCLKEGRTCLNCKECWKTCYARKASLLYPSTYNYRVLYTHLAETNLNRYRDILSASIDENILTGMKYLRPHEAGDFFSQKYVDMWDGIIKDFPNLDFYFYTKVDGILNFKEIERNHNLNIVRSILPNGMKNYGSYEWLIEMHEKYGYPICPFSKQDDNTKCGRCTICMEHEHVLFLEH